MEAKTATIAQKSIDAQIIERHLETAEVGQLVTYVELSQLVGRDVQKKDRHLLETAKRSLLRRGMVFETVWSEGVKRVTDNENITNRQRDFAHIRRAAGTSLKKLACVNQDALDNEAKIKFNATASHLGVIRQLTGRKAIEAVEKQTRESQQQLPLAKTVEAAMRK